MEPKLLLLAVLVAGSQAVPIIDTASRETCSSTCTGTNKFGYQPGTTYEFDYDVDTTTLMQGASEGKSGIKMSAKVYMEIVSKCEVTIRVGSVTLHERDPESPENFLLSAASKEFSKTLEEHPLRVSFQDGRIESVCPVDGEKTWVLNIKRGVLSMIQNTMDDLNTDQKVKESDVAGTCDADYSVKENGWYSVTIKKHKNLLGCTRRHGYVSAIQGTPYNVPSEIQSLPLMKSNHECEQVISKSGILQKASCMEQHLLRPFSRQGSGAVTESKQSLKYVQEMQGISAAKPISKKTDMNFEHAYDAGKKMETRKDIERKLIDICELTKDDVRPETPQLFTDLVHRLRTVDTDTLERVYQSVQSGTLCSDNNQKVRKFFLDAIPMTGTSASLKMMTKLITNNDVSGIEADMWMTTLAFIQHPTKDMIKDVTPLVVKNGKSMLAVTSLLHKYCQTSPCEMDTDVKELVLKLENKIGYGCYVDENNIDNVVLTLRALGNAGYISAALPTINSCVTRKENPMEVRVAAVEAFRRASCDLNRMEPMTVLKNKEEDSELRIAAYLTVMECPSQSVLGDVKTTLEAEEVNQVGSFIWSHLTNLMETSNPHKQNIRSILEDEILKKEFDLDKRKFSRNYEGSLFWDKINTGASVESNIIWSSKSFIPRSAMTNLTVDLFGHSINIFEVGGRVEGLDYFLESYFGPNGYFGGSDVKKASKQTVKGIDSKKMNKIEGQFGSDMDKLKGALYMRVFGNELGYTSFRGLNSLLNKDNFNILEVLIGLSKNNDYTFTQNTMFLDSSMIIPTSAGFPLNLTVNGSATIDFKVSGKIDLRKLGSSPRSLSVAGQIRPSAAVQISSMMSVDAFVTKSGLKMVSTLHSSTLMKGHIELKDGQILSTKWDMPKDKMEIISVKSAFFTVHRDREREQKMVTENRQTKQICSGRKLAKITGLELCGELQFPNASLKSDAPYFPFTGPVIMDVTLYKRDDHKSYEFITKLSNSRRELGMSVAFDTPGSKVDRAMSTEFLLKKDEQKLQMSLISPWKIASLKGAVQNTKALKHFGGELSVDGKTLYEIVTEISKSRKGNSYIYTPSVLLTAPKIKPIKLEGQAEYQPAKVLDVALTLSGLSREPIETQVSFVNKKSMKSAKATLSFEKKKEYSFESRLQTTDNKKSVKYIPFLAIKSPANVLFAFGGSAEIKSGKAFIMDFTVDQITDKPMKFSVILQNRSFKKSLRCQAKVDLRTPIITTRVRSDIYARAKSVSTRTMLDYVIPRVSRDKISLNGKMILPSTKSIKVVKGNWNLALKRRTQFNTALKFELSHNKKHSEAEIDMSYGDNKKDVSKRLYLLSAVDHVMLKKQKKYTFQINNKLEYPAFGISFQLKGMHAQTTRAVDTDLSMVFGKKQTISGSLSLKDKSTKLLSKTGDLTISYPGRDITISNAFTQTNGKKYTNTLTVQYEKGKKSVIESAFRISEPKQFDVSTSLRLQDMSPVVITGKYRPILRNFLADTQLQLGKTKYALTASSQYKKGQYLQLSTEYECPSRRVSAEIEGSIKKPLHTGKLDVKWDVNRDNSKRILLRGDLTLDGVNNFAANMVHSGILGQVKINMKHQGGQTYNSHAAFEWGRKNKISIDSVVSMQDEKSSGTFQLITPFKGYKQISIQGNHSADKAQYTSSVEMDWKPMKKIAGTVTLKRPLSLNNFDATIDVKSPLEGFERSSIRVAHKYDGKVETLLKTSWNKQKVQLDIFGNNKGNDRRTDLAARINMKSTLDSLTSFYIAARHNGDDRKFETGVNVDYNGNAFSYESEVTHYRSGFQIQNTGRIALQTPWKKAETTWTHRNTDSEIVSNLKFKAGRDIIEFNLDTRQDMTLPQGTLSFKAGMKSPFRILQDVEMVILHEHRPGFIDSSASMKQDGSSIFSILNKYRRQNDQATSSHVLSLRGNSMSIITSTKYENYPLTGTIEIAFGPETKTFFEGNLEVSPRGLFNGNLNLNTPLVTFRQVSLSFNQDKEGREKVSRMTLQYPRQSVVMETRTQWDRKKSISFTITSPLKSFQNLMAAVEFTGDRRSFHTSANFKLQPIFDKVSLSSQWSAVDGIIASVKLQTPFKEFPYSQIKINCKAQGENTDTDITIEYLPRKEIKIQSSVRPQLDNLEGMVKVSTPFDFLPYTAASLQHTGNREQFNSKAELEYEAGKKLTGQVSFKNTDKLEGSILIKTPFTNDVSAEFEHIGIADGFVSNAKLMHGLSKKYETSASYGKRAGTFSIKTPFMDDVNAAYNNRNNRNGLQSHGEVQYGSQKKYEVDVKYGNLEGSLALKSPLTKDMSAAFNHKGGIREFQSHAEFNHGSDKKYEMDVKLDKQSGSVLIKSPISEDVSAGYRHTGEFSDFKTHIEARYGRNKKYEGDVSFTSNDFTEARIALKSPVSKDLSAGIMYRRNATHFSSNADAQYGGGNKYETSLTIAINNKVQGSFSLKTPMTNDILAKYSHEGNSKQFKFHCSVQNSKEKKYQLDTAFSNARKIKGSFFVKTPFTDDVTAAFVHQGDLKKFDSSAELQYAPKKKFQASVNFMNIRKTSGSFAFKSSVSPDITASFKHSGDLSQFSTIASIHVNKEKKFSVDADFLNKKRTKGTLKIQSPFTDDITLKIGHKGKRTDFRLDTDLSIGKDKYDSTLSFRSRKDLSVSLLLATPIKGYKKIKTVLTHSGSIKSFKTRGEFSIGKEAVSANMKFTLKPNLAAKLEIETPFKGYKKVTTELAHEGNLQKFKCNGKVSRGKSTEFNAGIDFSVSPKVSVSVSIQTPFKGFKNTEARFSHAGTMRSFQSEANVVYLNKRQIDLTAKVNIDTDISADITLATPFEGFERFCVIVSQTGTRKDFIAKAEVSNVSGKKLAAGARFSMTNALSGEFTLTTPVQNMETTRVAFSHDGTMNNFRSHAEVLFFNKKSEADVSFSSLGNTEGNLVVKTPIFKTVTASISYKDQPTIVNADIEYGKDKMFGTEMKLTTSPSIEAEVSVKSAFAKDIYASVIHRGSASNFLTQTEVAYGKNSITTENKFNVESDISISSKINTPFVGYERFVGAFSHSGVISDFRCHMEGSLNKDRIEGDITFTSVGTVEGTVAIRTPFGNLKEVQFSFRHAGDMRNFNTQAEAIFDGRKTEADISLDTTSKINTRVSLKDRSIEDIMFTFDHEGSVQRFATHSVLQYSGLKQVEFDVDLKSLRNFVLTTYLRSSCPYLQDIQVDISRKGPLNNFKALSIFNINGKSVSGKFDLDTRTGIDSKATLKTPVSEDIVMSFNHNGNYENLHSKGYLQFSGSRQYELETTWNKRPSTDSSITVKTPFRDFSTLRASVKHNEDFNSLKSGVSIQYYKGNVMEVSINVQKGDDMKGSALLTAPFMPDLAASFGHRADMSSFKSMGELKIDNQEQLASSIEYRFGSRKSGSFMIRAIGNQLDTSFSHEGDLENFNSHIEVSLNGDKTSAEAKFTNDQQLSGSVQILSPFQNLEDIGGSFSHKYLDGSLTSNARLFSSDKSVIGNVVFNSRDVIDGSITITTPFSGFERTSIGFRHSFVGMEMASHANFAYAADKEVKADITFSNRRLIKGTATLKTPFSGFEETSASFRHALSFSQLVHHSEISYGQQQKIETDITASLVSPYSGSMTMKSPFAGLEESKASFGFKTDKSGFQGKAVGTFQQQSVEGTVQYSSEGPMEGSISIKTPFSGLEETSASFRHAFSSSRLVHHSEINYGRQQKIKTDIAASFVSPFSGSMIVKSPFIGFEEAKVSFELVTNRAGFQGKATGTFRQESVEGTVQYSSEGPMKGSISIKTPFLGLEETSASFRHALSSSQLAHHSEINYGRQQKIETDIAASFVSPFSGSMTVKSPFSGFEESKVSFELTTNRAGFQGKAVGTFRQESVEGTVQFSGEGPMEGSISIKTPFSGFEESKVSFELTTNRPGFQGKAVGTFRQESVEGTVQYSSEGPMEGSISIKTPFLGLEETSASFRYDLSSSQLAHHTEINYGRQQKIKTDIAASFVSPFSGSMTVKSPFSGFEESKVSFELTTNRAGFQGKAVGTFRQESVEGTVQFSGEGPMEGSISIKTPFSGLEETSASFRHALSSSRLVHHSEINYRRQQKIETDIVASFVSPFSGSVIVKSPFIGFEESKVSFELVSDRAGFKGKTAGTFRQESVEGTVHYSGEGPMEGSISIKTPFSGLEETKASFRHIFTSLSLQHHAEIVYGRHQKQIETDIEGSFAAPYFGSVTIKTPFLGFEESKALIEFVPNQQSFQCKAEGLFRQQVIEGNVQFSGKGPIQGTVSLKTPFKGYETSVASFTHDASSSGILNKMEIAFKGETAQSTVRFNNAKKVQFSANVRTPFRGLESTTTSFGYTPSKYGFKAQADAMYQKDKYAIDMSYNSESKLEGSVTVKTPFSDYKKTQASFVHSMSGSALNSHADVTFRGDKYEGDISFNSQPSLTGTLTIKTPITNYEFSQAEIRHAVTKSALRSHGEIIFGGEKYEGDISFDSLPTLEGSIVVKTPFVKYETSKAAFSHVKTIGSISSHAEIAFAEKKSEIDFTYNNGNTNGASVTLKTPFSGFEMTTASLRNDIGNSKIDSHAELIYGKQKKIELDVSGSQGSQIKGSIELKTPFKSFETTKYSMKYVPSQTGLAAQADLVYGRKQKISSDVTYSLRDNAFDGSFGFNTPFSKKLSASTSNSLTIDGFSSHTMASYGSKKVEINANLDLSDNIAASASIKTPFKDFKNTAMKLNAVGNIYDFDGKVKLQYRSAQVIAVALKHQMSTEKIESKFTAETPYTDDISVKYEKDGPWTSFTSKTEASVGQRYSYNQRSAFHSSAGIIDISDTETWTIAGERGSSSVTFKQEISMDNYKTSMSAEYNGDKIFAETELITTDPLEGSFVLQTPFESMRDFNGKFSHSGELNQFISSGEFQYNNMEKVEAKIDFSRSSWRHLNTNVELKTPFTGMEYTKVHVKHNGNRNGIMCSGELTYGSNEQITGSLKALKQPMEIDISITTPFEGFEKLSTQAKLTSKDDKYVAEASAAKSSDSIDFKSYIEISSVPITGMIQLNTPFSGFESSKIVISHKGDLNNIQSSVDMQSSSTQDINAAAMFQYSSPFEMDGSITLATGITGAESIKMAITNRRNGDEVSSHVEGSWGPDNVIILDSTLGVSKDNAGKFNIMLSTPFEKLRSMNIKASHGYSNQNLKDNLYADLNGKALIDLDSAFSASDKYTASFELREPHPMSFSAEGRVTDAMKSGFVSLNWDKDTDDSQIRFEGSLNDNSDSYTDKLDMKLKVSCPTRSVGIKGSVERSSDRLATSMDLLNDDVSVLGYDMDSSKVSRRNNIQTSHSLKLKCPSRSVQLSGSFGDRYGIKTAEGVLMWDADRDSSKKIGLRTKYVPQGDAAKADITFEMPNIGEDVQLDSEMTINSGKVLFDSKTEFKYSKDSRKTLVINSRLEDVAFGSNKNYTFSFDLKHIDSSVDIQLKSHVGQTSDRYSAGVDVDYLTAKKNKQNFALMGEIDSLRKQLDVEMRSPVKSMRIKSNIKTSAPYSISVQNVCDKESPMNTELTLDPARRSIDFQINYDTENPSNVLHMTAKYVNDSALLGEIFRIENSRRITDTLMAIRLNTSRILHSRIHWRPTIIQELKAVGLGRISIQSNKMNTGFQSVATSVREELNQKYNFIRQSASEGIRPYASFVQQIIAELKDELTNLNQYMDYDTDTISKLLTSIDSIMESLKTVSRKDFPMKEQYDFYVEASRELMELTEKETRRYYAGIMDLLDEQFKELGIVLEQAYNKYQDTMSKISGNGAIEFINSNIKKGQDKLSNLDVMGQLTSTAVQYTSAIYVYGAREAINKKMTGPVLVDIKNYGLQTYQMGANAYKSWEIEENIKSVMEAVYQLVREEIEEEFASIKHGLANLKGTKFTVFDLSNGEIQMDTFLPIAMQSLKSLPTVSFNKHYQRMQSYMPNTKRWGSVADYIPDSDMHNWIPPFRASARIEGDHIITFDGKDFDINRKCAYILARDYVDGNFSVIMTYLGAQKKKLIVMTATQTLQVAPNGKVRVDGKTVATPYKSAELSVSEDGGLLIIKGSGFQMSYDLTRDSLDLDVSGWYFGKLGGLFGTPNNEKFDDMMMPSRQITDDANSLANTWEVHSKCR